MPASKTAEEEQERKEAGNDSSQGEEQEVNTTEASLDFCNLLKVINRLKKAGNLRW